MERVKDWTRQKCELADLEPVKIKENGNINNTINFK